MIATSAKLAELLEAASPGPWRAVLSYPENDKPEHTVLGDGDRTVVAHAVQEGNGKLAALAPALARLVLELSDEFQYMTGMLEEGGMPSGSDLANAREALAAVEKLEL